MNDPVTKASLLRDMRAAWRESEALLAGLGEADLRRPGAEGNWSVKDVLAHLAGYERLYVESAEAQLRGELQCLEEVRALSPEERNRWDVQQSRQRPLTRSWPSHGTSSSDCWRWWRASPRRLSSSRSPSRASPNPS